MLPPTSLSGTLRQDRDLGTPVSGQDPGVSESLAGGDSTSLSTKDWWELLRQGDAQALIAKPVHVSGYVIDEKNPSELWVGRLLITCCAVDARPMGVLVSLPGWHDGFAKTTGSTSPEPSARTPIPSPRNLSW